MTAYLDKLTGDIITKDEFKSLGLDARPFELDLEVIHKGGGDKGIACECELCGSPLGSVDPDRAAWIRLRVCSDCRC